LLIEARAAYKRLSANRTGLCLREIGLSLLGAVAREAGEYEFAEQCLLKTIVSSRSKGARQILCGSLLHLAKLYWDTGDSSRGRSTLAQAMGMIADNGYVTFWDLHLPTLVEMAARCVREQIQPDYALQLVARYYGKEAAVGLASAAAGDGEARLREAAAACEPGCRREGRGEAKAQVAVAVTRITARLFGQFEISVNDIIIPQAAWVTRKSAGILKYLLLHSDSKVNRDRLMDLFWPDSDQGAAAVSLRVALHELRKVLARYGIPVAEGSVIISDQRHDLRIGNGVSLHVDAGEFLTLNGELHCQASTRMAGDGGALQPRVAILEKMIDLYRGPLLEGEDYLDWALEAREHLESLFLEASISLAVICMSRGELAESAGEHERAVEEYGRAEELLTRALNTDRHNEEVCLHLIRLYTATSRKGRAIKLYDDFTKRLQQELGIQPDVKLARAKPLGF
jgi:DNA-binding SARP family transcriptional activator